MNVKIICDSSCNILQRSDINYESVPLKVITDQREYIDDACLDVEEMLKDFSEYEGKSTTSCPNAQEWYKAFGDADVIFGISITSGLSGCYNAAMIAKQMYLEEYPDKKVHIFDSLSTGPEMLLICEKLISLIKEGIAFEDIIEEVNDYMKTTHLMFSLSSLDNFARNGRISPAVAKSASVFGIRVVGKASEEGTLEPTGLCRGQKKALKKLVDDMEKEGYTGSKVIVAHTNNEEVALQFKELIHADYPSADVVIMKNLGLCSYYAEKGGMLIGFEG